METTCCRELVFKLLATKELVDVHKLIAVLAKVQVLLIPVVQIHVEIGSVEEQDDLLSSDSLITGLICGWTVYIQNKGTHRVCEQILHSG